VNYEDRYYTTDVSHSMLQEYLDITHAPKTARASIEAEKRKEEIRAHIFTEAFSSFADKYAPIEPQLKVVT